MKKRIYIETNEIFSTYTWNFLKGFICRYDRMIVSNESYKRDDISIKQEVIYPSIDPLTPKNMELSDSKISKLLKKTEIETNQ